VQGIFRLAYSEIEAVAEPLDVCAVDVCAMVKQSVERFAVMGEVPEIVSLYVESKRSCWRLTEVCDDHLI
jgi:hypothetical protein